MVKTFIYQDSTKLKNYKDVNQTNIHPLFHFSTKTVLSRETETSCVCMFSYLRLKFLIKLRQLFTLNFRRILYLKNKIQIAEFCLF